MAINFVNNDLVQHTLHNTLNSYEVGICNANQVIFDETYWSCLFRCSKYQVVRNCNLFLDQLKNTESLFLWKNEVLWTSFKGNNFVFSSKNELEFYDALFMKIGMVLGKSLTGMDFIISHCKNSNPAIAAFRNRINLDFCEESEYDLKAWKKEFESKTVQTLLF